jgi:hypothetical protein
MKRILLLAGFAYVGLLTQTMSAYVIGTLSVANCTSGGTGGVLVTSSTITWQPVGSGGANTGCISAGNGTSLAWSGAGSMTSGSLGYIQDLPQTPAPPPVLPFMVFPALAGNPTQTLNFFLTNGFAFTPPIGFQGSGQAACTAANTAGDSCILFTGSPFLLKGNANGTTEVDLFAAGTVADPNNGTISTWAGTFETNLPELPSAVYNQICGPTNSTPTAANCLGSAQSTYANTIIVIGPEPGTTAMMLTGGLLLVFSVKKRKARV